MTAQAASSIKSAPLLQARNNLILHQALYAAAKLGVADLLNGGARATAERLLSRVASRPLTVLDQNFATTLSIGVASADGCDTLEELMARADRAMYRAKKEGRARVCTAPPAAPPAKAGGT